MHNEEAAFEYIESLLWPTGAVCPHCGVVLNMTGGNRKGSKGTKGAQDNPAQSESFIKAAKKLGVDESGKAFEAAMRTLAKPKRKPASN